MQPDDTSRANTAAQKSRERQRISLYKKYGITHKQYLELLRRQGFKCAICHKEEPLKYLAIDHDHRCCPKNKSCGKCIRGLLCSRCNTGISMLQDDSATLESAIAYLEGVEVVKVKASLKAKKANKRRPRKLVAYLTVPEKDRLFKVIENVRDRAIFRLLYHHGLRASEIGKLDLAHFRQGSKLEFDRLLITRLKGSLSGEHPMVPSAALAMRAWVRKRGYMEGPLFPSRQRSRITRCRIFQLMRQYCKAAGIPAEKAHPHCLKHTCCTHLLSQQRESIVDVQKHVGHASIKNTMIYADLTSEANEARAKRLREWK